MTCGWVSRDGRRGEHGRERFQCALPGALGSASRPASAQRCCNSPAFSAPLRLPACAPTAVPSLPAVPGAANTRGNLFSRNHTGLDPGQPAFWDFRWIGGENLGRAKTVPGARKSGFHMHALLARFARFAPPCALRAPLLRPTHDLPSPRGSLSALLARSLVLQLGRHGSIRHACCGELCAEAE